MTIKIFEYNPLGSYDLDFNAIIDSAESAKQLIFSPTVVGVNYRLNLDQKNGVLDCIENEDRILFIPDNDGKFELGDYLILSLRGQGKITVSSENQANVTQLGGISNQLAPGEQYILRSYGANEWTLAASGGGRNGNNSLIVAQPSVAGESIPLNYVSTGDTNGLFYYLGTAGKTIPYQNPVDTGKIVFSTNSTLTNLSQISDLSDGSGASFVGGQGKYLRIKIANGGIFNFSSIQLFISSPARTLKFQGSMDELNWFELGELIPDASNSVSWQVISATEGGYYTYFQLIDETEDLYVWNIYQIELYGQLIFPPYNYAIDSADKGKLLLFSNPAPQLLTLDSNEFSEGDSIYLQLESNTVEVFGQILIGMGRLYQLIKTRTNWYILAINTQGRSRIEYNQELLVGNKILNSKDASIQILDPNGSNRYVELPLLIEGMQYTIINNSNGSYGLIIQERLTEDAPPINRISLNNQTEKIAEIKALRNTWFIETRGSYS